MKLVDDILAKLPRLSPDELATVMVRCRALTAYSGTAAPPGKAAVKKGRSNEDRYEYLIEGLRTTLSSRNLLVKFSNETLHGMKSYKSFLKDAGAIDEWINKLVPGMTRTERFAVGVLCSEALADYFSQFPRFTVSLQTLLVNYKSLPKAFEWAFPGYAEQGWTRVLISGIQNGVCLRGENEGPGDGV